MVIGSKELIRDINRHIVLESIIQNGPISRASLSKQLGLTKATISTIVQNLLQQQLVKEVGSGDTDIGRKPILLTYQKEAGYALCIDIQMTTCTAVLSNLKADMISYNTFDSPSNPKDLPDILISYIKNIELTLEPTTYGLIGITLSIHGVTYHDQIAFSPYYDLAGLELCKILKDHFSIPVYLENEANLSAIAEKTFIYCHSDIASVSIHSGVGLGLILGNHLITGYKGYTGEVGHMIIEPNGRPCPCGNYGCLEQYVSQSALLREMAARKGVSSVTFAAFIALYRNGDKDALATMQDFITYMTIGLNNILNAYNPEILVINSNFTSVIPELTDQIVAGLNCRMNNYEHIVASTLHGQSTVLGGLSLAIRHFLNIKHLHFKELPVILSSAGNTPFF